MIESVSMTIDFELEDGDSGPRSETREVIGYQATIGGLAFQEAANPAVYWFIPWRRIRRVGRTMLPGETRMEVQR